LLKPMRPTGAKAVAADGETAAGSMACSFSRAMSSSYCGFPHL